MKDKVNLLQHYSIKITLNIQEPRLRLLESIEELGVTPSIEIKLKINSIV